MPNVPIENVLEFGGVERCRMGRTAESGTTAATQYRRKPFVPVLRQGRVEDLVGSEGEIVRNAGEVDQFRKTLNRLNEILVRCGGNRWCCRSARRHA
jgi:hypothetical protein